MTKYGNNKSGIFESNSGSNTPPNNEENVPISASPGSPKSTSVSDYVEARSKRSKLCLRPLDESYYAIPVSWPVDDVTEPIILFSKSISSMELKSMFYGGKNVKGRKMERSWKDNFYKNKRTPNQFWDQVMRPRNSQILLETRSRKVINYDQLEAALDKAVETTSHEPHEDGVTRNARLSAISLGLSKQCEEEQEQQFSGDLGSPELTAERVSSAIADYHLARRFNGPLIDRLDIIVEAEGQRYSPEVIRLVGAFSREIFKRRSLRNLCNSVITRTNPSVTATIIGNEIKSHLSSLHPAEVDQMEQRDYDYDYHKSSNSWPSDYCQGVAARLLINEIRAAVFGDHSYLFSEEQKVALIQYLNMQCASVRRSYLERQKAICNGTEVSNSIPALTEGDSTPTSDPLCSLTWYLNHIEPNEKVFISNGYRLPKVDSVSVVTEIAKTHRSEGEEEQRFLRLLLTKLTEMSAGGDGNDLPDTVPNVPKPGTSKPQKEALNNLFGLIKANSSTMDPPPATSTSSSTSKELPELPPLKLDPVDVHNLPFKLVPLNVTYREYVGQLRSLKAQLDELTQTVSTALMSTMKKLVSMHSSSANQGLDQLLESVAAEASASADRDAASSGEPSPASNRGPSGSEVDNKKKIVEYTKRWKAAMQKPDPPMSKQVTDLVDKLMAVAKKSMDRVPLLPFAIIAVTRESDLMVKRLETILSGEVRVCVCGLCMHCHLRRTSHRLSFDDLEKLEEMYSNKSTVHLAVRETLDVKPECVEKLFPLTKMDLAACLADPDTKLLLENSFIVVAPYIQPGVTNDQGINLSYLNTVHHSRGLYSSALAPRDGNHLLFDGNRRPLIFLRSRIAFGIFRRGIPTHTKQETIGSAHSIVESYAYQRAVVESFIHPKAAFIFNQHRIYNRVIQSLKENPSVGEVDTTDIWLATKGISTGAHVELLKMTRDPKPKSASQRNLDASSSESQPISSNKEPNKSLISKLSAGVDKIKRIFNSTNPPDDDETEGTGTKIQIRANTRFRTIIEEIQRAEKLTQGLYKGDSNRLNGDFLTDIAALDDNVAPVWGLCGGGGVGNITTDPAFGCVPNEVVVTREVLPIRFDYPLALLEYDKRYGGDVQDMGAPGVDSIPTVSGSRGTALEQQQQRKRASRNRHFSGDLPTTAVPDRVDSWLQNALNMPIMTSKRRVPPPQRVKGKDDRDVTEKIQRSKGNWSRLRVIKEAEAVLEQYQKIMQPPESLFEAKTLDVMEIGDVYPTVEARALYRLIISEGLTIDPLPVEDDEEEDYSDADADVASSCSHDDPPMTEDTLTGDSAQCQCGRDHGPEGQGLPLGIGTDAMSNAGGRVYQFSGEGPEGMSQLWEGISGMSEFAESSGQPILLTLQIRDHEGREHNQVVVLAPTSKNGTRRTTPPSGSGTERTEGNKTDKLEDEPFPRR